MDWQSELGEYFGKHGVYRMDYLHKQLDLWIMDYSSYLKSFMDVSTEISLVHDLEETVPVKYISLTVNSRKHGLDSGLGFRIFCGFDSQTALRMKTAVGLEYSLATDSSVADPRIYKEETFMEPERMEKEYIFQLISSRMQAYFEVAGK